MLRTFSVILSQPSPPNIVNYLDAQPHNQKILSFQKARQQSIAHQREVQPSTLYH